MFTKYPNMVEYMYGEITKRVLITFSGAKSSVQLLIQCFDIFQEQGGI